MILDSKRGDVGSTAKQYAAAAFEHLGADCVTLSPYLGWDAIEPFLSYPDRGVFVLCATSNPSAKQIQDDALRAKIALACASGGDWDARCAEGSRPLGMVVGATDVRALELVRSLNRDSWILAPGVGAQGAELGAATQAALARPEDPRIIVPVSRGIADAPHGYAAAACELRDAINAALRFGPPASTHTLAPFRSRFVQCAIASGALTFGDFTLKSGRRSPYFFNAGLICRGDYVDALFSAYADCILAANLDFSVVFGPAYKGIPLCAGVAAALAKRGKYVDFAYNRKEAKDHGELGFLVGAPVHGRSVLLVDDVVSAGTAIREAVTLLSENQARLVAVCVGLDRQEVAGGKELTHPDRPRLSALDTLVAELAVPVVAVVTLADLLTYVQHDSHLRQYAEAMRDYRRDYGAEVIGHT